MRLIVDVMNVLHAWRGGPEGGKGADVVALARAIRRSRFAGWEVLLVCDGTPPPGTDTPDGGYEAHACRVLFSGAGVEADEVIETLLAGSGPVRETVIVSADRRLGRAARKRGARSMSSGTFIGVLIEDARASQARAARGDAEPEEAMGTGEVAAWLEEFGIDKGRGTPGEPAPAGDDAERPGQPGGSEHDDWLAEAEREWRISQEEMDMERWLDDPGSGGNAGRG